jgi:hypothetical protein
MQIKECLDQLLANPLPERLGDDLIKTCLDQAPEGLVMEFGVASGGSFRVILNATDRHCFGFDSFKGLPETVEGWTEGTFACEVPKFEESNAHIVIGLIQDTLPGFLDNNAPPAAFVHIDTDIYSAAKYIFDTLYDRGRIVPGTIILFDELFNCEANSYAAWSHHEYKAFVEFGERTGLGVEFLGRRAANSYAFKIL